MIKNKVNDKFYIGSSVNIKERWNKHKYEANRNNHKSRYFQNAWNKYGEENFEFLIIEETDKVNLLQREQYYLDKYKPYERIRGYNTYKSAEHSRLGIKHSEATKEKIGKMFKGKKISESHKKNISNGLKGRKIADKTKMKISNKNKKFSDKEIDKIIYLYENGFTYPKIAKEMGCVKTTIYSLFKKLFKEGKVIKRSDKRREEVLKLLKDTEIPQKEISKITGVSEGQISQYKKEMNI